MTLFRNIIKIISFFSYIAIISAGIAIDQPEDHQKKDKAVRILQRKIRDFHFKNEMFETMYKQGLEYRDGKEKDYEKDSIFSKSPAGFHFFPLASEGFAKAQHNLGMIYYAQGNYEAAYNWLKKASDQGLKPSIKNLGILTEEMSRALLRLPPECLACVSSYPDNNSLLAFRVTAHTSAAVVDQEFLSRAKIKMPLACLTSAARPHPFPNTASYFLRKRLWQIPGIQPLNAKKRTPIFAKCAEFSKDWEYPGWGVFKIGTNPLLKNASSKSTFLHNLCFDNPTHMDDRDTRELILYQFSHSATNEVHHPTQTFESFLAGASRMITLGEGEIAIYYLMNYARYSLKHSFATKNFTNSKLSFKKAAEAGDVEALHRYGWLLGEEIKTEGNIKIKEEKQKEMAECFKISADKGNKDAQYDFAVNLGITEEAKRYYKMAADQGHPQASHNLAYIIKMERESR